MNRIENMWREFSKIHKLELQDTEQHLIFVPNKKQSYKAKELNDKYVISYKYIFYKLDTINAGNRFEISIPIETKQRFELTYPNWISRIFTKTTFSLKSSTQFELDKNLIDNVTLIFKEFSDLKIILSGSNNIQDSARDTVCTLKLITRLLPNDIDQLENLRALTIRFYDYLFNKEK